LGDQRRLQKPRRLATQRLGWNITRVEQCHGLNGQACMR
jgi:hypothetical protein